MSNESINWKSEIEIRKDIKWREWYYQVSNFGRVRSLDRKIRADKWFFVKKWIILKDHDDWYWYFDVALQRNWTHKRHKVHRLVAQAFIDNPNSKKDINHKNWNKHDNAVNNLEWNTRSENIIHAYEVLKRPPSMGGLGKTCKWKWQESPKTTSYYNR